MIKLLACFFMLIDHVGLIFFPSAVWLRIVGRLSMPLFAYCIARGFYYTYRKNTFITYEKRVLFFAVFSQLPFSMMVQENTLNIGFLWLLSIPALYCIENFDLLLCKFCLLFIFAVSYIVPMDYGFYGILLTIIFYLFRFYPETISKDGLYFACIGLHVFYIPIRPSFAFMQIFSLATLPIIDKVCYIDNVVHMKKQFYYLFYPIHIIVLLIVRYSIA